MSRVVLDTSALYYPQALALLETQPRPVIVPTIVLLERARQLRASGRDGWSDVVVLASAAGWDIEAFDAAHARRTARLAPLDPRIWRTINRDAMIAGHVGDDDAIWTANPRDFLHLGLKEQQVVDVTKL